MGAGQQLAGRLLAQHLLAPGVSQQAGRVGLAALDLVDLQHAGETRDVGRQPCCEPGDVEGILSGDSVCA